MPPPSLLPACASRSDAGAAAAAAVSVFAMRPRAPGPLWPLPWGALAWAVGFVGSVGSGDPSPGEWGGRKRRVGWTTHVGLPGMRTGGMLGVEAAVAAGRWRAMTRGRCRLNPGGLGAPPPPAPKGLKEGNQEVSRTDVTLSQLWSIVVTRTDIY